MKNNTKKEYSAPALTVVTFKVEQGFATSGGPMRTLLSGMLDEEEVQSQETWQEVDHTSQGWF